MIEIPSEMIAAFRRGWDADEDDQHIRNGLAAALSAVIAVLPEGTTTEERWSVRWTWPDGETDDMDCERLRGSADTRTSRERAQAHASRHVGKGITGEARRRVVYTTPDETVERYEPDQPTPITGSSAASGGESR